MKAAIWSPITVNLFYDVDLCGDEKREMSKRAAKGTGHWDGRG